MSDVALVCLLVLAFLVGALVAVMLYAPRWPR